MGAATGGTPESREADSLFRELRGPMLGMAIRYLGNKANAEEAVNETFARFLRSRRSLRSDHPAVLRDYLFTTLRNLLATPQPNWVEFKPEMMDSASTSPQDPQDAPHSARVSDARLQAAIARLPAALHVPLLLAIFEGLPHKAIAKRLSISVVAVALRIFKAKRKLKTLLEQDADDDATPLRRTAARKEAR